MKFCKNLQRVVDISDPEWAPYWTNYKMLKKIIKDLPSLVPSEDGASKATTESANIRARAPSTECRPQSPDEESLASSFTAASVAHQYHGDRTAETKTTRFSSIPTRMEAVMHNSDENRDILDELGKNPGEIAFFKLLHSELRKATHFFDRAQQEFSIRQERIQEGMEIMKKPNSIMVADKWSLLAKSIFRLYKDLMLLETFAIMTYCSFSKILKKHDKVTGYQTKSAFMENVVNKANFTSYPKILQMIERCETMYDQVSERLLQEGKEGLYEDERLFISMISRLNEQALDQDDSTDIRKESRRSSLSRVTFTSVGNQGASQPESHVISTLRSMVEENDVLASMAKASERGDGNDSAKRRILTNNKRPLDDRKPAASKQRKHKR